MPITFILTPVDVIPVKIHHDLELKRTLHVAKKV